MTSKWSARSSKPSAPEQTRGRQSHGADLLGVSRLAVDAVLGVTELAEAMHLRLLGKAAGVPLTRLLVRPVVHTTALAYRSVKGVTRLVGGSVDAVFGRLPAHLGGRGDWAGRQALLAALNGVLGDRLAASGNPLAIPMTLLRDGLPAAPAGRIAVLVHGLCMHDGQWRHNGVDHGAALERARGYTVLRLHYNSGLHISLNGREFARQLEALLEQWPAPVEELAIVGYSMGALVARSACHYGAEAGHGWLARLRKMVFLGAPHHGAPFERGGNWITAVTGSSLVGAPLSRLARIRSAGITDLRHGSLLDDDWRGKDRFAHDAALPQVVPLPSSVQCFAIAAILGKDRRAIAGRVAGDGLVPLASALGQHPRPARRLRFEPANRAVVARTSHLGLLSSLQVQEQLLAWL
jgi:hypothetical protein